jgi:hypothetical protein
VRDDTVLTPHDSPPVDRSSRAEEGATVRHSTRQGEIAFQELESRTRRWGLVHLYGSSNLTCLRARRGQQRQIVRLSEPSPGRADRAQSASHFSVTRVASYQIG